MSRRQCCELKKVLHEKLLGATRILLKGSIFANIGVHCRTLSYIVEHRIVICRT